MLWVRFYKEDKWLRFHEAKATQYATAREILKNFVFLVWQGNPRMSHNTRILPAGRTPKGGKK